MLFNHQHHDHPITADADLRVFPHMIFFHRYTYLLKRQVSYNIIFFYIKEPEKNLSILLCKLIYYLLTRFPLFQRLDVTCYRLETSQC